MRNHKNNKYFFIFCIISLMFIMLFDAIRHISLLSVPFIWYIVKILLPLHPKIK